MSTNKSIRVREATVDDVVAIVRIYVDSWNLGIGARVPPIAADVYRIERWRRDLSAGEPTRWWVAEIGASEGSAPTMEGFVGICPCRDPVIAGLGELTPLPWRQRVGTGASARR